MSKGLKAYIRIDRLIKRREDKLENLPERSLERFKIERELHFLKEAKAMCELRIKAYKRKRRVVNEKLFKLRSIQGNDKKAAKP